MGFYNESPLVYLASPSLKRCYPEMRALMFSALSRFAFIHGDDYWGYRFAGWGLHYMQDLTMPYHASVMPGSSTSKLVWVGLLDLLGISGPYNRLVNDVSNKHLLLEMLQLERINSLYSKVDFEHYLVRALQQNSATETSFTEEYIRDLIAFNARAAGADVDEAPEQVIRNRELYESLHEFYEIENYDIYEVSYVPDTEQFLRFQNVLETILTEPGTRSKSYINWILSGAATGKTSAL